MTKEELEQEAIQYAVDYPTSYGKGYKHKDLRIAYLAGAEPREKRIEELIALINAERERQEKCDDIHLRTIAELEKENAELKEKLNFSTQYYQGEKAKEQLTKAKELLKQWLQTSKASGCDNINIVTDTEQFLNSEVEK